LADYVVKVREKGLITLPEELVEKYGLREGSELLLRDEGGRMTLEPRYRMEDLFGVAREHVAVLYEAVRELHEERRREARS